MLIDEATITIKAGDGGDGAVSFRREKYVPKGGPDGGNGGTGGNIYFTATTDITALKRFRYQKHFIAPSGKPGLSRKKSGANGTDLILNIPIGTQITDTQTHQKFEILTPNTSIKIAQGGQGGRGNAEFRSSTNTTPRQFQRGGLGQKCTLYLQLQLIAHIGLIGLPNAGKSSLLNILTSAHAKVASYPFTTLEPNLGTLNNIILADIPGLIKGASHGKGLGHKFLRHINRTKILAHCLSCESPNPITDYHTIRQELKHHSPKLISKPEIIILTKIDLLKPTQISNITKKLQPLNQKIIPCSIYQPPTLKTLRLQLTRLFRKLT